MNIVEAFIKFNEKLIIIISGLSGSGKSQIASNIERDFKIKKIDIETMCVESFDTVVELPNGIKVKDWDHIDAYDWDKINKEIEDSQKTGVVVCGPNFPEDKITFNPNFHIHIKISKQLLIEKRHDFIKNNPDKCAELIQYLDTPTETLIINHVTYPHYLEYSQKSKIDKYINSKDITIDQIYDQTTDYLFYKIQEYLNQHDKSMPVPKEGSSFIEGTNKLETISPSSDDSTPKSNSSDSVFLGTTYEDPDQGITYMDNSYKKEHRIGIAGYERNSYIQK